MKNRNSKLAFGLTVFTCILLATCNNSIMEKWWAEDEGTPKPLPPAAGPIYHVVSFEPDGGSPALGDQLIAHEGKIAKVPVVAKAHHGFGGWYRSAGRTGNAWDFATDTVDKDLTLFAKWVPVSYTITFETNGGSPVPTEQTLLSGAKVKEPSAMTHVNGHGFGGWFTDAAFTGEAWNFAKDTVDESLTLYARWVETFYTVKFVDNDGASIVEEQRIAQGGKVVEPLAQNKDHYVFDGWFADAGLTERWNFSTRTVNNNLTLYARWERDRYIVTFNANGGSPAPANQQIAYPGKAVEPPVMNRAGHGFGGWFTDAAFANKWDFSNTVDKSLTLYARWNTAFLTVTFNANGGSPAPANQQIAQGEKAAEPPAMSRAGHGFGGWFADSGLTVKWDFAANPVNTNLTLHAKWVPIPVSVTFIANGGSPIPTAQAILAGATAKEPPPGMALAGHGFGGWFTNTGLTNEWDFATPVTGNLVLYAKWDPQPRTVTFVANGGSPEPSVQDIAYGGKVAEPLPMTKAHHGFGGWFRSADFSGNAWNFATDSVGENLTLYAKWETDHHTVSFAAYDGAPSPANQLVAWGSKVTRPAPMAKDGYHFGGWFTNADFSGDTWDFANGIVTNSITLYAWWEPDQYTVTFVEAGGLPVPVEQRILHGSKAISPAPMTKTGFSFGGWFANPSFTGSAWNFATDTVKGKLTLYAKWERNHSTVTFMANGGEPPPEQQRVLYEGTVTRPAPMTRTDFTFGGWFANIGFTGNAWDFVSDTVLGDIILYARWEKNPPVYTVTFDADPGVPMSASTASPWPEAQRIVEGMRAVEPASLRKRLAPNSDFFYGFGGWFTANGTGGNWGSEWNFAKNTVNASITLYAKWDEPHCTVTFMPDGGSPVPETQDLIAGARVKAPLAISKPGHGFVGWFSDQTFTKEWNFNTDIPTSETLVLYARWVTSQYEVAFEADGGTPAPGRQTVAHGNRIQSPEPMTKVGMGFQGWYTNANVRWNFDADTVDRTMTLYAKWSYIYYTVSFDATPSPSPVASQSVAFGGSVVQPANPPQLGDGRAFGGWFTEDGTYNEWGRLWDFSGDKITGDTTLYAKWVYQTRTAAFMVNGGTDMSPSHVTISILAGGRIINPGSPTRAGHDFAGWFTDLGFTQQWSFSADRLTEPDEAPGVDPFYLYAKWIPNSYTVSFNVSNGDSPNAQTITYGERATRPILTNVGMALVGWYRNSNLTNEWDFSNDLVTSNMTLYAKWETASYTVTFDLRPPPVYAPHPQPERQNVTYSSKIAEPFMPPLASSDTASWSFLRWDYSTDGSGNRETLRPWNFEDPVTENVVLYARWVPPVPDMVWVPRGSFVMGESGVSGSPAAYHAYPTRTVTMDGFYIGRNLVTQEEYERVMSGNPFGVTSRPSQFQAGQPTRPVERVSWYDALAFANALSDSKGLWRVYNISVTDIATTMGITNISRAIVDVDWNRSGFRLPTEAEWEFAARGGNGSPNGFVYAGSNNADDVAWFNANSGSQTRPVGTKQPNALGIFDMNGNVSEWCWDLFDSYKNMIRDIPAAELNNNPKGAHARPDLAEERVRRGGSWNNVAGNVRSVVRNSAAPDSANWVIGFRLARNPDLNAIW